MADSSALTIGLGVNERTKNAFSLTTEFSRGEVCEMMTTGVCDYRDSTISDDVVYGRLARYLLRILTQDRSRSLEK